MRFDFTDLSIFLSLSRTLNISETAFEVNLTPSAVSLRLRKMEDAFGVQFFAREARGLRLLPAGRVMVGHARALCDRASLMEDDLSAFVGGGIRPLRIASNSTGLRNHLAEPAGFFVKETHVRCDFLEHRSEYICEAVAAGTADLGFCLTTAAKTMGNKIRIRPFISDRHVIVTPKDHPLANKASVSFAETLTYDYLSLSEPSPMTRAMHERALACGLEFKPIIQMPSFSLIARLVSEGSGIAVVPRSSLRHMPDIAVVELTDAWACRPLAFILPAETAPRPEALDFISHCFAFYGLKEPAAE